MKRIFLLAYCLIPLCGCDTLRDPAFGVATLQGAEQNRAMFESQGLLNPLPNSNIGSLSPTPIVNTKLMLFGGRGGRVYLGCLNCGEYATDSVFNKYGNNGSRYSGESIFNRYGDFGSRYSDFSPWDPYANNPPVIVDKSGNFYGRLTKNKFHPQRTTIPVLLEFLDAFDPNNQ